MKTPPRKVYILEDGTYIEMPYIVLKDLIQQEGSWGQRKFLRLGDILMEVKPSDYREYYRYRRRQKYVSKCASENGEISVDDERYGNLIQQITDGQPDILELVTQRIMLENLHGAILRLNVEDRLLVYRYYFENHSQREMAKLYGISHQAVGERLKRVTQKLREKMGIIL